MKLILYEDFAAAPRLVYDEVIEFLEVPHAGRAEFARINSNKRARIAWLKQVLRKPPPLLGRSVRCVKRLLGGRRIADLKAGLVRLNTVTAGRAALPTRLRAEMVETFRDEVHLLSRLLDPDPSHWSLGRA